jgi:hypothetical protein
MVANKKCVNYQTRQIDDLDRYEIIWREQERRRVERDNEACGFTPDRSAAGKNEKEC